MNLGTSQEQVDIVFVVPGALDNALRLAEKFSVAQANLCLAAESEETLAKYRVRVTPFITLVGDDGRVRSKGLGDEPAKLLHHLSEAGLGDAARAVSAVPVVPHE